MADREDRPSRLDNNPPGPPLDEIDPELLVDPVIIKPLLDLNYKALLDRRDELRAVIAQWVKEHTPEGKTKPVITGEQDLKDTQDRIKQLRDFIAKEVEPARERVKGPLNDANKAVQAWFVAGISAVIEADMRPVQDARTDALKKKEDVERTERRRAALIAAQEAERLAEQARRATDTYQQDALLEQAVEAEVEAKRLVQVAEASLADLTRTRGDLGSVGGLKSSWRWQVESLMDLVLAVAHGQESIDMLTTNDRVIDALVKPKDGRRKITGLTIFEEKTAR